MWTTCRCDPYRVIYMPHARRRQNQFSLSFFRRPRLVHRLVKAEFDWDFALRIFSFSFSFPSFSFNDLLQFHMTFHSFVAGSGMLSDSHNNRENVCETRKSRLNLRRKKTQSRNLCRVKSSFFCDKFHLIENAYKFDQVSNLPSSRANYQHLRFVWAFRLFFPFLCSIDLIWRMKNVQCHTTQYPIYAR